MTALTPQQKERQRFARSRAGQIRFGMQNYIETLGVIAMARAEADHITLGYESWQAYVDGEFGDARIQLPAEMRRKAVEELRLAGASHREIAHTVGVSHTQVKRDLGGTNVPPEAPRSALVEAMTGAIEDATERAQDHREPAPGVGADTRVGVSVPGPEVAASGEDEGASSSASSSGDLRPATPPPSRGSSPQPVPPMPAESYALVRDGERRAALVGRVVEALDELMEHAADPAQIVAEVLPTMRPRLAVVTRAHDYLTRLREEIENHERVQTSAA